MSRQLDAGTQLERALVHGAREAGIALAILSADWSRWASATFTGARHRVTVAAPASPAFDAWLAALPEAEFKLRGHLVADLVVGDDRHDRDLVEVELEVLTVEDC